MEVGLPLFLRCLVAALWLGRKRNLLGMGLWYAVPALTSFVADEPGGYEADLNPSRLQINPSFSLPVGCSARGLLASERCVW